MGEETLDFFISIIYCLGKQSMEVSDSMSGRNGARDAGSAKMETKLLLGLWGFGLTVRFEFIGTGGGMYFLVPEMGCKRAFLQDG